MPTSLRLIRAVRLALLGALATLLGVSGVTSAGPAPAPAADAPARTYLPLVAGARAPETPDKPGAPGASSLALIEAALARGEIDAETALIYRVYLSFGDERLPARFRGDDQGREYEVMGELVNRFEGLSPATRATLAPFLIPPIYAGSWSAGAGAALQSVERPACDQLLANWDFIQLKSQPVRIWYERGKPHHFMHATSIGQEIESVIWPKIAGYLAPAKPLSDERHFCNGGSGDVDIYVVDRPGSEVVAMTSCVGNQRPTPAYMLLSPSSGRPTVAHEVFHLFEYAYTLAQGCLTDDENAWWGEGSADWARQLVYGYGDRGEHLTAGIFLRTPEAPLETVDSGQFDGRHYGTNLWAFFLETKVGAGTVRATWEAMASRGSLEAINSVIPGGFAAQWPEFAKLNWNQPPVDQYRQLDGLQAGAAAHEGSLRLGGAPHRSVTLATDVPHLAATYHRYVIDDPAITTVAFHNPFVLEAWPTARVWGMVRLAGSQQWEAPQDWTARPSVSFCRELIAERIAEVAIIISNSEWQDKGHRVKPVDQPRLDVSNLACRGWTGTVSYRSMARDELMPGVFLSEINRDIHTTVTLRRATPPPWLGQDMLYFEADIATKPRVRSYGYAYDSSEPPRKCTFDASATAAIEPLRIRLAISTSGERWYDALGDIQELSLKYADSCGATGDERITTAWWEVRPQTGGNPDRIVSADGRQISGRYGVDGSDNPNSISLYTWTLTALPPE